MNSKFKLVFIAMALVMVIAIAGLAYNTLSENYENNGANKPQSSTSQGGNNSESQSSSEEKVAAPDFTFTDTDGSEVKFSSFVGKPIVLNFWASWCPPCKSEMPDFDKLAAELGSDVTFIMLNATDGGRETLETAKAFLEEQSYTFPVYFDTLQEGAYTYGITSLPTTVFIDKDGYIVTYSLGMLSDKKLREKVDMITG